MKRLLTLLLPVLLVPSLLVPAAFGQSQRFVLSSAPGDGTAAVGLETTVSFTFNGSIPREAVESLITVLPEFAVDVTDTSVSADGRTVSFDVVHRADTDYYWLVQGTYEDDGGNGVRVSLPYLLYYTTAATVGPYTVSGSITPVDASVKNEGAVVALLDRNAFATAGGLDSALVRGVGVALPGSGAFTVRYVRAGTVWPGALTTTDLDDVGGDDGFPGGDLFASIGVGFYDPNGDRLPDPLTITGDVSGLELSLYSLGSFAVTASTARASAEAAGVEGALAGADAVYIGADGRAVVWAFTYHEAGADSITYVTVLPLLGLEIQTYALDDVFVDVTPLPDGFVDSDAALAVAESNGGADFRAEHPAAFVSASAGSEARFILEGTPYAGAEAWVVSYLAFSMEGVDVLTVIVDLETGAFIGVLTGDVTQPGMWLSNALDAARAYAGTAGEDYGLIGFEAASVDLYSGTSTGWTFRMYSPQQNTLLVLHVGGEAGLGAEFFPNPGLSDTRTLPETVVDSDVAIAAAFDAGGEAFLDTYGAVDVRLRGGYFPGEYPAFGDRALVEVTFTARNDGAAPAAAATFTALVDASSGEVVDTRTSTDAEDDAAAPAAVALSANYPNPFNPSTTMPFVLAAPGPVRLAVYDVLGREVAVLVDGVVGAGAHAATWNADGFPSGLYLYRLEAAGTRVTRTMTLTK